MDLSYKTVLLVDLETRNSDVKSFGDLNKYIGGVGVGIKLLSEFFPKDPISFSVGPLNGYFPFCSKTSIVLNSDGVIEDLYIGGSLSSRIKFTGLDAICLLGKSSTPIHLSIQDDAVSFYEKEVDLDSLGLPGKRSNISWTQDINEKKIQVDKYFSAHERILEKKFIQKNIRGISVTGTKTFSLPKSDSYTKIFDEILKRKADISVKEGTSPSCVGCPMGCKESSLGEIGGNVIPHSMVACGYANKIYSDVGTAFACLNSLGYSYKHEDIENLPDLLNSIIKNITQS